MLVSTNVIVEIPPTSKVGAENDLVIETLPTNNVADAVVPVPPLVEVTFPVVFTNVPAAVAMTWTVTVQFPPARIVAPGVMPMVFPSATPPVTVPGVDPALQTTFEPGVALLMMPAG